MVENLETPNSSGMNAVNSVAALMRSSQYLVAVTHARSEIRYLLVGNLSLLCYPVGNHPQAEQTFESGQ